MTSVILAPLMAAGIGLAPVQTPTEQKRQLCEQYGIARVLESRYKVQNNVWGANTSQCLNVNPNKAGFLVTRAEHRKTPNGAPAAYPSIFAGCNWGQCTHESGLPLRADHPRFNRVRSSVEFKYPSAGVWNAAYDIWFDPRPRTDGPNTGAEIMIWLNQQGPIRPVGSRVASVQLAGAKWDVWFGHTKRNVVSYIRTKPSRTLTFTVNAFYSDAVRRGYAERDWYLTSVHAGYEEWRGGTGAQVKDFSFTPAGN